MKESVLHIWFEFYLEIMINNEPITSNFRGSLPEMISNSTAQFNTDTIHNAALFTDTSTMLDIIQSIL